MFEKISSEQFGRIVSIVALLLGVGTEQIEGTVAVIGALVIGIAQLAGYIKRFMKGDVTIMGVRK